MLRIMSKPVVIQHEEGHSPIVIANRQEAPELAGGQVGKCFPMAKNNQGPDFFAAFKGIFHSPGSEALLKDFL